MKSDSEYLYTVVIWLGILFAGALLWAGQTLHIDSLVVLGTSISGLFFVAALLDLLSDYKEKL